jgi:hypothetical protein
MSLTAMKSGWAGLSREEHLRRVARMRRPKLATREMPPGDVAMLIHQTEMYLARLRGGSELAAELATAGNTEELQHLASDSD